MITTIYCKVCPKRNAIHTNMGRYHLCPFMKEKLNQAHYLTCPFTKRDLITAGATKFSPAMSQAILPTVAHPDPPESCQTLQLPTTTQLPQWSQMVWPSLHPSCAETGQLGLSVSNRPTPLSYPFSCFPVPLLFLRREQRQHELEIRMEPMPNSCSPLCVCMCVGGPFPMSAFEGYLSCCRLQDEIQQLP